MDKLSVTRRNFLSNGFKLGGSLTALLASSPTLAALCGLTPAQMEGPYYPESDLERDSDLVQLEMGGATAKGQIIFISGKVQDKACKPVNVMGMTKSLQERIFVAANVLSRRQRLQ